MAINFSFIDIDVNIHRGDSASARVEDYLYAFAVRNVLWRFCKAVTIKPPRYCCLKSPSPSRNNDNVRNNHEGQPMLMHNLWLSGTMG